MNRSHLEFRYIFRTSMCAKRYKVNQEILEKIVWKGKIAISLQILFASMDSIWDTSCLTSGIAGEGNCSVWLLTVTDHRASTFFGFFLFSRKSLNCSKTQSSSWVQRGYVVWTIHAPQIAIHHNPQDACLKFRCLDLPWDTVSKKMLV